MLSYVVFLRDPTSLNKHTVLAVRYTCLYLGDFSWLEADGRGAGKILGLAQFGAPPESLSLERSPVEQSLFFKLLGRDSKKPWQASSTPPIVF